jgi:hypothetical protein
LADTGRLIVTKTNGTPFGQLAISVSQLDGGSGASSTTFWRGDGTWATPSGGGSGALGEAAIEFVIDGTGGAITPGVKGYLEVPYGCVINAVRMLANPAGSVAVDIWRCKFAQYDGGVTHPVNADSITASDTPTITGGASMVDTTLTGWTTTLDQGDILAFNVDSASTIQRVTLSLDVTKSAGTSAGAIEFVIDGGGGVIATGVKGYLEVPWAATIDAVRILAVPTGSVVLDIWKCSFAQYDGGVTHPVAGDSITASDTPTITSGASMVDTTLTGWTTALNEGDILAFDVRSVSAFTRLTVSLDVIKS